MFDLHCHILPALDDGAADLSVALEMARMFIADGVKVVACTPHILPGLYQNTGPDIRASIDRLKLALREADLDLELVCGSDAHICPDFVAKLKTGTILSLADSRYVLVEPPHHVAPLRIEQLFFEILVAGYVPILTHPERLTWVTAQYAMIQRLAEAGVWMQVTAGSLLGDFGKRPRYLAERMLDEGIVHLLATDAHDATRRPPNLSFGAEAAAKRVGEGEALNLVFARPRGILQNDAPSAVPLPSVRTITTPRRA